MNGLVGAKVFCGVKVCMHPWIDGLKNYADPLQRSKVHFQITHWLA
jgi:hypothetical protein